MRLSAILLTTVEEHANLLVAEGALTMSSVRSKTCIITFMGPVGVGKSTQMRLLEDHLKSENVKVVKTFIKSSHGLAYVLGRLLLALGANERVSYPDGFARVYPRKDVVRGLFTLWSFLDTLSIAIKFFFTVYVPFSLGFTILIEEGLLMTLHTYLVSFPSFFKTEPRVLPLLPSLLGWIVGKNHVNVVLDATDEELGRRRIGRSYRQNELPEYVNLQKKWIKRVNLGDTIIETTDDSVIEVHKKIVAALEKRRVHKCTLRSR